MQSAETVMERVEGIEPSSPAWKAGVYIFQIINLIIIYFTYSRKFAFRTTEGLPICETSFDSVSARKYTAKN